MNNKLSLTLISLSIVTIIVLFAIASYVFLQQQQAEEMPLPVQEQTDTTEDDLLQEPSTQTFIDYELVDTELHGLVEKYSGWIENPTTGDLQSVRIYRLAEKGIYPLITLIPGGTGNGSAFEDKQMSAMNAPFSDTLTLVQEGFVVVVYDPLGTGQSEGELNYQGHADQDGLAAIIAAAQALPETDEDNSGLASFSYGITGAAGVIARYPELGIKFWSDWEGPSSRQSITVGCQPKPRNVNIQSPAYFSCDNTDHWREREAAEFMNNLSINYYWRIQEKEDHVQAAYSHTIEMLEAAAQNEKVGWFKVNDAPPNTLYTEETLPTAPNDDHYNTYIIPHLVEMAAME